MNKEYFTSHYSAFLNCRVKSVYELLLFSDILADPRLLSLLSQNSNAYCSTINFKGIEIPVFSSLHPCAEKNILDRLNIPYMNRIINSIDDVKDLVRDDIPVLISYDADSLSRGVKSHNFGLISATVLWKYDKPFFTSTRKTENGFEEYKEDAVALAMTVETQPVAANREIIYLSSDIPFSKELSMDLLLEKISENLLSARENARQKASLKIPKFQCVEGASAFEDMRASIRKLNQTINLQHSEDIAHRMFILANTIILKIIEKNGFGFDSFQHCFWDGYEEYLRLTGQTLPNDLGELAQKIGGRWKEMNELLVHLKSYSANAETINEFFEHFDQMFADIENMEHTLFSEIVV